MNTNYTGSKGITKDGEDIFFMTDGEEGSAAFVVQNDGMIEIAVTHHPDVPHSVEVVTREFARAAWRAMLAQGWEVC